MLMNTVILFLRDGLPIFVLVVYLCVHLLANKLWLSSCFIAGAIFSLIYINQYMSLANGLMAKALSYPYGCPNRLFTYWLMSRN
jgi:high-affinity iron transporter